MLPQDKKERKTYPITRGLLDYFPDACAYVAHVSFVANEQHNPGEPMHWAREKSTDHDDCISRHTIERGTWDDDRLRHSGKRAWRALAALQLELEAAQNAGEPWDAPEGSDYAVRLKPAYTAAQGIQRDPGDENDHTRLWTGNWRCTICREEFSTPQGLTAHMERGHVIR